MSSRPPPYWGYPSNSTPGSPSRQHPGMVPPMIPPPPGSPVHFLTHPPPPPGVPPQQNQFPFFLPYPPQHGMFGSAPLPYPHPPPMQPKAAEGMPLPYPPMPTTGLTFRSGVYDLEAIEAHMSNMMIHNTADSTPKPLTESPTKSKDTTISPNVSSFLAAAVIPTPTVPALAPTPMHTTTNSLPVAAASPGISLPTRSESPPPPPSSSPPPSLPTVHSSPRSGRKDKRNNAGQQTRQLHTQRSPEAQRAFRKLSSGSGSLAGMKFVPKQPSPTPSEDNIQQKGKEQPSEQMAAENATSADSFTELVREIRDTRMVEIEPDKILAEEFNSPQAHRAGDQTVSNNNSSSSSNNNNARPSNSFPQRHVAPLSLSKLERIAREAQETFIASVPATSDSGARLALVARLQKMVSEKWPNADARLHMFGSSANDMCLVSGDIDLCLLINEDVSGPESLVVRHLGQMLTKNNMKNVSPLPKARVPIVKFKDPKSNLSCDICINNPLAIHNTRLVADYTRVDPRMRVLSYLIKYWAKCRKINNPYTGTLSSYAYVNLVTFYLQTRSPPVLPCLQKLADNFSERVIVDEYDCTYFNDIDSLVGFGNQNRDSMAELLYGFFRFYAYDFDYMRTVVSIRSGTPLTKEDKGWSRSAFRENTWICIEDPFEITHNLGRVCDKSSLHIIRNELQRAYKVLTSSGSWKLVCDPEILKKL